MTKVYFLVSGIIFLAVSIVHVFRLINHWDVSIGGRVVPMSVSWGGVMAGTVLFLWAMSSMSKSK